MVGVRGDADWRSGKAGSLPLCFSKTKLFMQAPLNPFSTRLAFGKLKCSVFVVSLTTKLSLAGSEIGMQTRMASDLIVQPLLPLPPRVEC